MAISILCKELVEKDFVVVDDFCSKKDCARLRDFIVEKRTQDKMLSGTWNTPFFFLMFQSRHSNHKNVSHIKSLRKSTLECGLYCDVTPTLEHRYGVVIESEKERKECEKRVCRKIEKDYKE